MCGIFGYVGKQDSVSVVLQGLKKLEYRGYDSAGIAGLRGDEVQCCKAVGKVSHLEKQVHKAKMSLDVAIAHTRWATHGMPTQQNAHPQMDVKKSLAVVHNGIIENYESLKQYLQEKHRVVFVSETDTEVIAHLISVNYQGDIIEALRKTCHQLQGSYAIALVHRHCPDRIIAVAHESPLVIGIGAKEAFISSDSHAFSAHTREVVFLSNAEIALVSPDKLEVFDSAMEPVDKRPQKLDFDLEEVSKGAYGHYTLKEIHEQPQTLRNAILSRYVEEYGTAFFEELDPEIHEFQSIERILILGCGTSLHAGYIASYMIEQKARIPVQVEISSEFRYKNPIILPATLVIAISQSGETADTLAAVRELKTKGAKVIAICNVYGSTLAREADIFISQRSGPEIGVCSTKAFTSQLAILSLLALLLARMRHMDVGQGRSFLAALRKIPDQVAEVVESAAQIERIAKEYARYDNFFYLGRGYMFPTSLEGALKLKEISYINANGYPAGEIKHGPIALISENFPTVAFCAHKATFAKLLSNLREIKARRGPVIAIAEQKQKGLDKVADEVIRIPDTIDELACIPASVAAQLLAYYIALERGTDIDQPRNLAKSVTVE